MIRYGRADCQHVWRFRSDGWVEECVPAICIKCGAFGCICDIYIEPVPPKDVFFGEGCTGDANINGEWVNPYVKQKEKRAVV